MTSPTNASPIPTARSLKSRVSIGASAAAGSPNLSSKTRIILQKLEKVHTPAKELRRLPVLRCAKPEQWANGSFNASFGTLGAPPLRMTRNTPTRLQLLATSMYSENKTPYWRDICRPSMKERDEAIKKRDKTVAEDMDGSKTHPLFDVPSPKKKAEETTRHHRVSVFKGIDGVSRNVFNTKRLDEEDFNPMPLPKVVLMPVVPIPEKGFLGDLAFTFELPKTRMEGAPKPVVLDADASDDSHASDVEESEMSEDNDGVENDEDVEGKSTTVEKAIEAEVEIQYQSVIEIEVKSAVKSSTADAADSSIQTAAPIYSALEENETDASINDAVPEKHATSIILPIAMDAKSATWTCNTCFVSSTGDKCVCCGTCKDGTSATAAPAPQKELTSNISEFKSKGTFKFGFGEPVTWTCTACFVSSTGDKCVCCGTCKNGPSATGAPAPQKELTSNISEFKSKGEFKFGFGAGPAKPVPTTEEPFSRTLIPISEQSSEPAPKRDIIGSCIFGNSVPSLNLSSTPAPSLSSSSSFSSVFNVGSSAAAPASQPFVFGTNTAPSATLPPTLSIFGTSITNPATTTGTALLLASQSSTSETANAAPKLELSSNISEFETKGESKFGFGTLATSRKRQGSGSENRFGSATNPFARTLAPISEQSSEPAPKRDMFGSSIFGNSVPSLNFSSTPAPSLSSSSSFGSVFNFGSTPAVPAGQPFVFGANPAPTATPTPALSVFGTATTNPATATGNAFAYQPSAPSHSAATRKIAQVRRRMAGRK